MVAKISVLLSLAWVLSFAAAAPAAPNLINYQGTLVDGAGLPVHGPVPVEFALFDADLGGEALWSEPHSVTLDNGAYQVLLGSVTPFPADLFAADVLWLELTVGGEVLAPRQQLSSVPFSLSARRAGCNPGDFISCYNAEPAGIDVGLCRAGKRFCRPDGSGFGDCVGMVLPATESCNDLDDDCDGVVDEDCPVDSDGDGFGNATDCNDSDPAVYPGALEICGDGLDNNCDGTAGEGCLGQPCDDGDACTQGEVVGGADLCEGGHNPCDGGSLCASPGLCTSLGDGFSCEYTPDDSQCDDGNPCTTDVCDAISGCQNGHAPDSMSCDDGDPQTATSWCVDGVCTGS